MPVDPSTERSEHPPSPPSPPLRSIIPSCSSPTASNFLFLNTVPTETLTGPCAVKKAVAATLEKHSKASITPTIVNFRVSQKGVTLTDVKRKYAVDF